MLDIASPTAQSEYDAAFAAFASAAVCQATAFVCIFDVRLRPRFLNAAGREMVGISADADVTGYEICDFFTPQHRRIVETVGLPTTLREGRWEAELCLRHFIDASRETAVRWSAFALRSAAGELIGAAAFTCAISAREQAERTVCNDQVTLAARAVLASRSRFLEATLSSIPDFVYAFDPQRRFDYVSPAVLRLFRLSSNQLLGRTFAELDFPADLADRLNDYIDLIVREGVTVEDEVFYRCPTGYGAYFELRRSEARLRAATELVGLGIYSWDPITGALEWDERLRAMWGLPPDVEVNMDVYEAGIHPDDLPLVRHAIAACVDPASDGLYNIEYRVIGRVDGVTRHIATSGRTTFSQGRAVGFIGAAMDVTAQRRAEAGIRASESQFRSFADHSSNLMWIGDPRAGTIIYRSAAYEKIWGVPCREAPTDVNKWMEDVHPDDRRQVEHALDSLKAGSVVQFEYRIVRPSDGTIRSLCDTAFPILDEHGVVARIGGITEDLTREDVRQVYIVCTRASEARRLAGLVRTFGYRAQTFESSSAFLAMAPVLAPGCVLVDLRTATVEGLSIPRELKARSMTLPTIAVDAETNVGAAVAAMKAGAVDYVILGDDASLRAALANAMAECHSTVRPTIPDENAGARVARLTPREREVLVGLTEGGTNKSIGQKLGISPRTVELHRAQLMNRLNASTLTELLQIALAAGFAPSSGIARSQRGSI